MTDFEPPRYTPQEEYAPVDIFDIPARQKALGQPTELRPYNPFTLLGLWLGVFGFFIIGLTALALWGGKSPVFNIIFPLGVLGGAIFGIPAALCCLIGLYQLSFTGFEKGKGVSWFGLILAMLQVAFGIVGGWLTVDAAIKAVTLVQEASASLQQYLS